MRDGVTTHPGMAHFAGTGPHGALCRHCEHWSGVRAGEFATPRPAVCLRAKRMMGGKAIKAVPANALACSFFERAAA
jgi:hypothetical protein